MAANDTLEKIFMSSEEMFQGKIQDTIVSNAANRSRKMRSEIGFSREVIRELDNGGFSGFVAETQLKYFQRK